MERPEWRAAWEAWIAAKRAENPAFADIPDTLPPDWGNGGAHLAAFQIFLAEMEVGFMRGWTAFLRDELKCRALVTNQNGWENRATSHLGRALSYDFVDDHFYIDHPYFLDRRRRIGRTSPRNAGSASA